MPSIIEEMLINLSYLAMLSEVMEFNSDLYADSYLSCTSTCSASLKIKFKKHHILLSMFVLFF